MTFQAYLDNIKAQTGKTPDDFRTLARKKGLAKRSEIVAWLKADFALGHGHANAIAHVLVADNAPKLSADEEIDAHFKGGKAAWRKTYDALIKKVGRFGADVKAAPAKSYISLLRGDGKFGIIQISAADRIDIGIKRKGVPPDGRFEAAGAWNPMVTHRLRVSDPEQVDAEVIDWLRQAYKAAG
jgi:hypothetical protein